MTTRRKWRLVVLAIIVAVAWVCHAPLLCGLAGFLIADQPTDDYDCICISSWGHHPSGDRCYDVAADLYRRKPSCRLLLVAPDVNRLEQTGVMPSFESMSRRELRARHVPQEAVSVLRGQQWNDWATARVLAGWMGDHPGHGVLLLSDRFHSGRIRRAIDAVLEPDAAASVHLRALRNRDCDETNWWTLRSGYRAFAECWLLRIQGWLGGGDATRIPEQNADGYERDFLHALPENTP